MARPSESETEDSLGVSADSDGQAGPGVSAESDGQEHHGQPTPAASVNPDLVEYGKTLGVSDLSEDSNVYWVVLEAFEAALPTGWTEYVDPCGRMYFFNQVTEESTWTHPMDCVYRELIGVILRVKGDERVANAIAPALETRTQAVREHLMEVHSRATAKLDGWSGPYASETGPYYYNEHGGASTWVSPIDAWEYELAVRHSVLHRCLLADLLKLEPPVLSKSTGAEAAPLTTLPEAVALTMTTLQLPVGLTRVEDDSQNSSRSFYTPRESSRSGQSTRSFGACSGEMCGGAAGAGSAAAAPRLISA